MSQLTDKLCSQIDKHSINSKISFCKEETEGNFLRRNTYLYYP